MLFFCSNSIGYESAESGMLVKLLTRKTDAFSLKKGKGLMVRGAADLRRHDVSLSKRRLAG